MLSQGQTVLSMMDEALYIYKVTSRVANLVDVVAWDGEDFQEKVVSTLIDTCKKMPVTIVNDMVEQHYRKERVLTAGVSLLDRQAMIKRKLDMAFPNYPIRASIALKAESQKGSAAADVFIFAAVPSTKQFLKTIAAAEKAQVSIKGYGLLPIESADMVKNLVKKLSKKTPKWSVLIGQHRNGGLRQVVVRDGEIALTRMTPITDSDQDPQQWISEVVQEFRATMSYLSRFGFQPAEGLDVVLISNPTASELFAQTIEGTGFGFYGLTVSEAAKAVGLQIGPQEEERYADSLHASWIGKKVNLKSPLKSPVLDRISQPRKIAKIATYLLGISLLFFSFKCFTAFSDSLSNSSALEQQQRILRGLNAEYQEEVDKKSALGIDIRLIQNSIKIFEDLQKKNIKPLRYIRDLGQVLGKDFRIDKITVLSSDMVDQQKKNASQSRSRLRFAVPEQDGPLFRSTMQIKYPGDSDIEKGNKEIQELQERIQTKLPDHKVTVTKQLKDYKYIEEITVDADKKKSDDVQQDFIAEITVEGPAISD